MMRMSLPGLSQQQVTMEAWVGMANGLVTGLKFTYDIGELHPNGKVPMLDFQAWIAVETDPPGSVSPKVVMGVL